MRRSHRDLVAGLGCVRWRATSDSLFSVATVASGNGGKRIMNNKRKKEGEGPVKLGLQARRGDTIHYAASSALALPLDCMIIVIVKSFAWL